MTRSARRQRPKGTGSLYRRTAGTPYIGRWFDAAGRRVERSTRTTDKAAAERILAKHVADAALRRDGVIDARCDGYADAERKPLSEHVTEWTAALRARNRTERYVGQQVARVRELFARMHAERLSAVTLSRAQAALAELRGDGLTWRTVNYHAQAAGQFLRWCRRDRRIRENPLDGLARAQTATDRHYERRALDGAELQALVVATERGPLSEALSGADRAMLYRTAAGTGFRVGELASLTPTAFRLDDDPPTVVLDAGASKHRHADVQPIRSDLAELLRGWLDRRPVDAPLWPGTWSKHAARMIRADLRRAKAAWARAAHDRKERRERRDAGFLDVFDDAGRVVDFHTLRVSYITALVRGGASVKATQELARHSTPTLTLGVYTKLGVHDLTGALDGLPSLTPAAPDRERLRATGTDNAVADPRLYPRQLERETVPSGANTCDEARATRRIGSARKPLENKAKRDAMRSDATRCATGGGRIRTDEKRICNPLP